MHFNKDIRVWGTGLMGGGAALLLTGGAALPALVFGLGSYLVANAVVPSDELFQKELKDLVGQGEHNKLEFKESLSFKRNKISYEGIIRTIDAFANTEGGELLLGVSDDGKIIGLPPEILNAEKKDKFESSLRDAIRNGFNADIMKLYDIKFEIHSENWVCRIGVRKSRQFIFTYTGDIFKRNGNQTVRLTSEEVKKL